MVSMHPRAQARGLTGREHPRPSTAPARFCRLGDSLDPDRRQRRRMLLPEPLPLQPQPGGVRAVRVGQCGIEVGRDLKTGGGNLRGVGAGRGRHMANEYGAQLVLAA